MVERRSRAGRRLRVLVSPSSRSGDGRPIREPLLSAQERGGGQQGEGGARNARRARDRRQDAGDQARTADPLHSLGPRPSDCRAGQSGQCRKIRARFRETRQPRQQRRLSAGLLHAQRHRGSDPQSQLLRRGRRQDRQGDHRIDRRPRRRVPPLSRRRDRQLRRRARRPARLRARDAKGSIPRRAEPRRVLHGVQHPKSPVRRRAGAQRPVDGDRPRVSRARASGAAR